MPVLIAAEVCADGESGERFGLQDRRHRHHRARRGGPPRRRRVADRGRAPGSSRLAACPIWAVSAFFGCRCNQRCARGVF